MARSHHRRKHKQWQPPPHERKPKKGAASMFAVVGAVVGLGITFLPLTVMLLLRSSVYWLADLSVIILEKNLTKELPGNKHLFFSRKFNLR